VSAEELEWAAEEIERLTAALHAVMKHPDFDYVVTYGGSAAPPGARFGRGWVENTEVPGHGDMAAGIPAAWYWRRKKEDA
jgi:hypothetical protein